MAVSNGVKRHLFVSGVMLSQYLHKSGSGSIDTVAHPHMLSSVSPQRSTWQRGDFAALFQGFASMGHAALFAKFLWGSLLNNTMTADLQPMLTHSLVRVLWIA